MPIPDPLKGISALETRKRAEDQRRETSDHEYGEFCEYGPDHYNPKDYKEYPDPLPDHLRPVIFKTDVEWQKALEENGRKRTLAKLKGKPNKVGIHVKD